MTRHIRLTQGKVALVDDEDYEALNAHRWNAYRHRRTWYAKRWVKSPESPGGRRILRMHNAVLSVQEGLVVDHRNGDGLDNTRANLVLSTHQQNNWNQTHKAIGKTSMFRGVCRIRDRGKWRAQIKIDGVVIHLGDFDSEIDAAGAYDAACIARDPLHCCPNFSASFLAPTGG